MKIISDTLTVVFDSSLDDKAGMCVSRVVNGKIVVLKAELGEQADILYHLLTEQTTKGEIKAMNNDLTTYQIYLMLLGYLTERHDNTQMLENMLVELYRRANKAEADKSESEK